MKRFTWSCAALGIAWVLVGCGDDQHGTPCLHHDLSGVVSLGGETRLDLLFVIDDSSLVGSALAQLPAQAARMVRALSSGDRDGDGERDFGNIPSIRVGVVTTHLGSAGHALATCDDGRFGARLGDDGVLREPADASACAAFPPLMALERGEDPADVIAQLSCAVAVGASGCGWEQPLESALKALSPDAPTIWTAPGYVAPRFFDDTVGHATGANAGLVRSGSALAVIVVTDEDDCSVADPEILDPASVRYGGATLATRCAVFPDALHAIERYSASPSGLLSVRRNLVFAAIVGAPPDAVALEGAPPDYDAVLAHPAMQIVIEDRDPPRVRPSCSTPDVGNATPPRRIVETARALEQLGARTTVQSICQADLSPAFDAVTRQIIEATAGFAPCIAAPERVEECVLHELLPPESAFHCADLPGRRAAGTQMHRGTLRERCELMYIAPGGEGPGWTLERVAGAPAESLVADRCPRESAWIRFVGEPEPIDAATLWLTCGIREGPDGGSCEDDAGT
ncbi:MAG: hypothetical protein M3Y87_05740 [Myxococcota bacterium]|nr:hypothetical protein [Myxococcota bacterium]